MQNRVGSVIPTEQDIEHLIEDVESVSAKMERFTLALSAEERRHTRPRCVRMAIGSSS
jgi:hypothetical protein